MSAPRTSISVASRSTNSGAPNAARGARRRAAMTRHAASPKVKSLNPRGAGETSSSGALAERLTVKIVPPEGGMVTLTVESAMQQVLDTFRLLTAASEGVIWRLVSATTNSPFTVVAEAEETGAAVLQMRVFAQSLRELQSGIFPHAWRRPVPASASGSR